MTTAQVVEASVTVNNNSPIKDYFHPEDQTQPTCENSIKNLSTEFARFCRSKEHFLYTMYTKISFLNALNRICVNSKYIQVI